MKEQVTCGKSHNSSINSSKVSIEFSYCCTCSEKAPGHTLLYSKIQFHMSSLLETSPQTLCHCFSRQPVNDIVIESYCSLKIYTCTKAPRDFQPPHSADKADHSRINLSVRYSTVFKSGGCGEFPALLQDQQRMVCYNCRWE